MRVAAVVERIVIVQVTVQDIECLDPDSLLHECLELDMLRDSGKSVARERTLPEFRLKVLSSNKIRSRLQRD